MRAEETRREQGKRLAAARVAAGYRSAREAALSNGWSESTYRAHEGGTRTIGLDDAERYTRRFRATGADITAKSVLFGDMEDDLRKMGIGLEVVSPREERVASNQAPLMGRVGAGAEIDVEFEQPPPEGYDLVELPFAFPDPVIAFEIEGDSMFPVYEPGEVIVCLRDQLRATDHFLGERVVVRLSTGERYLKRLTRGFSRGRYNLESWNARTIEDVVVEWVGEIIAAVNPGAVRRIERRHQRAKQAAGKTPRKGQPGTAT